MSTNISPTTYHVNGHFMAHYGALNGAKSSTTSLCRITVGRDFGPAGPGGREDTATKTKTAPGLSIIRNIIPNIHAPILIGT